MSVFEYTRVTIEVLLVLSSPQALVPDAVILSGEAPYGNCPAFARLYVAEGLPNNHTWYGRGDPTEADFRILTYERISRLLPLPRATDEAGPDYVVSGDDVGVTGWHEYTAEIRTYTIEAGPPMKPPVWCRTGILFPFERRSP